MRIALVVEFSTSQDSVYAPFQRREESPGIWAILANRYVVCFFGRLLCLARSMCRMNVRCLNLVSILTEKREKSGTCLQAPRYSTMRHALQSCVESYNFRGDFAGSFRVCNGSLLHGGRACLEYLHVNDVCRSRLVKGSCSFTGR